MTVNRIRLVALMLVAGLCAPLYAQATNDGFEPNNNLAGATVAGCTHYSSQNIFGVLFNAPSFNEQLYLVSGDVDYFLINGAPDSVASVYVYQEGLAPTTAAIGVEVLDANGVVLAGPLSPPTAYRTLRTNGTGTSGVNDPYNGAVASATVTPAGNIYLRFYVVSGGIPSGQNLAYHWSVEFSTATLLPDASEGLYSNNHFLANAADATPAGTGSPRTTTLNARTYTGWDYYKVTLPQPGRINVSLTGFATTTGTQQINFDLFWIADTGGVLSFEGASDTFPPPNFNLTFPAAVNTSEALTTAPLGAGTYYFHVLSWVQLPPNQIGFYYTAGNYNIAFTVTNVTDDIYDTGSGNNDTAATAATLAAGVHSGLKMFYSSGLNEQDWYKVNVPNGGTLEVHLTHTAPATDNLDIELYRPNAANPGLIDDRIDFTFIPNNNSTVKTPAGTTPKEIVGIWGTVGSGGTTGYAAGDYLIRVIPGNVPADGTYSLTVYVNGAAGGPTLTPLSIAPEDTREPNDTLAEAQTSASARLLGGLTPGLKAMDGADWYKISASNGQSVEVTLIYTAGTEMDLDLEVYDMNTGSGALSNVADGLMNRNLTRESAGFQKVVVTANAGDAYAALGLTPPASGDIYFRVFRWASRGMNYAVNVNINNANPLTPLQINSVTVAAPKTMDASLGGSVNVTVNVSNTAAMGSENLTSLTLRLTHALGATVTTEYTITAPTPAMPVAVAAGASQNITFQITGNPATTNGIISVNAVGLSGTRRLPGDPADTFTVSGGVPAVAQLTYSNIRAGTTSNLVPGGVLILEAVVSNATGRATGTFNAPGSITFLAGSTTVTYQYVSTGTTNPVLPVAIPAGQTRTISWTYAIDGFATLGSITVSLAGGGGDNPVSGNGSFTLGSSLNPGPKGSGGGCSTGDDPRPLWLLVSLLLPALWFSRRRLAGR